MAGHTASQTRELITLHFPTLLVLWSFVVVVVLGFWVFFAFWVGLVWSGFFCLVGLTSLPSITWLYQMWS